MLSRAVLLAALGGFCVAGPAAAYLAPNGAIVRSTGPQSFAVPYFGGTSGAPDYWCAAGDFVIRSLGMNPATRIYRVSAQPVRGNGMSFSLGSAGAVASGLNVFGAKDAGLSAALAQVQCKNSLDDTLFGN